MKLEKINFQVDDYKYRNELLLASDAPVHRGYFAHFRGSKSTPQTLWDQKVNKTIPEDISNDPNIIRGKFLEPVIREKFIPKFHDIVVNEDFNTHYSPRYDFMACHTDGFLADYKDGLVIAEIKCPLITSKPRWKDENGKLYIPDYVRLQCLHILECIPKAIAIEVFAYFGLEVERLRMDRDQEEVDLYCETAQKFWNYVETKTEPPPLNNQDLARSDSRKKYLDQYKEADPYIKNEFMQIDEKSKQHKILGAEIDVHKFNIKKYTGSYKGIKENEIILGNLTRSKTKKGETTLRLDIKNSLVA